MFARAVVCSLLLLVSTAGFAEELKWLRGNTHTHTVLCGHADSPPEAVAQWYLDHGYNFLCLSEHNRFIKPQDVKLPPDRRTDFILVPSQEITNAVHSTALNINDLVAFGALNGAKSTVIQKHVDDTRQAGGTTILNHPNFQWALQAADMLPVKHLYMFELYNGHPDVHNDGDATHQSTEAIWDVLLTKGILMYAVASDDAHAFKTIAKKGSCPGRGFVMVHAPELTPNALTAAMLKGDFYASSGVILKTIEKSAKAYKVEVDLAATEKETKSSDLTPRAVKEGKPGWLIEFVGAEGKVLKSIEAAAGDYTPAADDKFVRCRVSFLVKSATGFDAYYAWTQPIFFDDRVKNADLPQK
jgi:hypothetical protein